MCTFTMGKVTEMTSFKYVCEMTAFKWIFISTQMASMPYLYNVICSIDIELLYQYYLIDKHVFGDDIVYLYDKTTYKLHSWSICHWMFIVSPTQRINLNEGIQYQFQGGELGNETEEGRRESGGEMGEEAPFPHPSVHLPLLVMWDALICSASFVWSSNGLCFT